MSRCCVDVHFIWHVPNSFFRSMSITLSWPEVVYLHVQRVDQWASVGNEIANLNVSCCMNFSNSFSCITVVSGLRAQFNLSSLPPQHEHPYLPHHFHFQPHPYASYSPHVLTNYISSPYTHNFHALLPSYYIPDCMPSFPPYVLPHISATTP